MEPLNNIDVVILVGIALSMLVAFIRGFVKEILSILGLILFLVLTFYLTPVLEPWLGKYIASVLMVKFVAFLLIMAVFYAIWIISTDKLIAKIRTSTLSFMDRIFGLLFGFLRAVLILGFCFLVVRVVLPEELKDGALKKSKYFMMAESCSDVIEKVLPENLIKDTVKSVEDINKAEKKVDNNKEKDKDVKADKQASEEKDEKKSSNLPSKLDQQQMDKMFELLIKPEIKNTQKESKKTISSPKSAGYDKKETNSLDRLIDITAE